MDIFINHNAALNKSCVRLYHGLIHRAAVIRMCLEEEQRRIWHEDGYTEGKQKDHSEKMNAPLNKVLEALKSSV